MQPYNPTDWRLYTLTNWMLRPIQQGIQPLHASNDMLVKYHPSGGFAHTNAAKIAWEWATSHKTVICLNGGNAAMMDAAWHKIHMLASKLDLPCQKFHEDWQSLYGALTSCCVVVPARLYTPSVLSTLTDPDEIEFATFIQSFNLAS